MSSPALKLTTYFNERARFGERFLADHVFDLYERHELRTSVLLRGAYGFGQHRSLRGDRLLTLSENLPAVSVAVDTPERIMHALPELLEAGRGMITLERARFTSDQPIAPPPGAPAFPGEAVKLTVYGARTMRAHGQPGYAAAVDVLRECGSDGAVVLLAVDGTLQGRRQRARFLARNAKVPMMLFAVGPAAAMRASLSEVRRLIPESVVTIERVQRLRTQGSSIATPMPVAERDPSGLPINQKVVVHVEEPATFEGHPLYLQLVRRLHAAEAAGVTVLRAVRGFYADDGPFADRLLSLRRRVPVLVTAIDTPANVRRWWPVIEELTAENGLVTSELVPAVHAAARGGAPQLELAVTPTAPDHPPPA